MPVPPLPPGADRPAPFADVTDLARRARLDRADLDALAAAGALTGLAGSRPQARWEVRGIEAPLPLFEEPRFQEDAPALPAPAEGEAIAADYASLGLSLGRHPLALLRPRLARRRVIGAATLAGLPGGRAARVAGLVTNRQRPDTASGVIFLTLEDETGFINVIVWNRVAERQRRILLGSRLLEVAGTVEREGEVVHLVAGHLTDRDAWLGDLVAKSRDFH